MLDLKEKDKRHNDQEFVSGKKVFFKQGLPGLENYREFTLRIIADNPFFYHLQATGEEALGLILLDPFPCFPSYSVELKAVDKLELQVEKKEDLLVLTTVTITRNGGMTTNLAAPLVLNLCRGLGRQVIFQERVDERRTPLLLKQENCRQGGISSIIIADKKEP